jgi:hypothetical protein
MVPLTPGAASLALGVLTSLKPKSIETPDGRALASLKNATGALAAASVAAGETADVVGGCRAAAEEVFQRLPRFEVAGLTDLVDVDEAAAAAAAAFEVSTGPGARGSAAVRVAFRTVAASIPGVKGSPLTLTDVATIVRAVEPDASEQIVADIYAEALEAGASTRSR